MKPVSPEVLAVLATRQFYVADIYTIAGGNLGSNVLRYCAGDMDITVNGQLYSAGGQVGPYFDRTDNKAKCHWTTGVQVDTLVLDVIPASSQIFGVSFLTAVRFGILDGAELTLDKVYMPVYGDTSRGIVRYFVGRIAEIDGGRSVVTITASSHLELLNQQMPRNIYQPGCTNNLGDATCLASVPTTTGTVTSGSTNSTIQATLAGGPFPAGAFNQGKLQFTSGVFNGLQFTIQTATLPSPSVVALLGFLPIPPTIGDTFTIFYGCNKSSTDANGCPKFSNLIHFRGFPFVPQPIIAV